MKKRKSKFFYISLGIAMVSIILSGFIPFSIGELESFPHADTTSGISIMKYSLSGYDEVILNPDYEENIRGFVSDLSCIKIRKVKKIYNIMESPSHYRIELLQEDGSSFIFLTDGPYVFAKRNGRYVLFETIEKEYLIETMDFNNLFIKREEG